MPNTVRTQGMASSFNSVHAVLQILLDRFVCPYLTEFVCSRMYPSI